MTGQTPERIPAVMPVVRSVALKGAVALLALLPVLGGAPTTAGADNVACNAQSLAPGLTGYGVMSQTGCNGPQPYEVVTTCNEILATWNGVSDWIPNGGAGACNSNGALLDFGSCAPGTWKYRTITILGRGPYVGGTVSDEVAIRC